MRNKVWVEVSVMLAVAGGLSICTPVLAQSQGQAIVTVTPKHAKELAPNLTQQDVQSIKVNGKQARVTSFQALRGDRSPVELVLLIDDAARSSLGKQMQETQQFVRALPPNVKIGIAYMDNGRAVFSGGLTGDHEQALRALRLPMGTPGTDASPYFCLSDLAKSWPSQDRSARREVVMVTDGIDTYNRRFDPNDPYVVAALNDAVRAGLVVNSIYWKDQGRLDNSGWENTAGQSLLNEIDEATGGKNFWEGFGDPVTFQPYFDDLIQRLHNQYEIGFDAPVSSKPAIATFKLKLTAPGADVEAPQQVLLVPAETARK